MSGNIPRSLESSTIAIRMLKLRARRSSLHPMRVSPSCRLRQNYESCKPLMSCAPAFRLKTYPLSKRRKQKEQAALEIAQEVRREYMKLYTWSSDGKPPPNVGPAEELKMSREETRASVSALHARDAVMELLLGAERITASEKQRILAVAVVWDAPLLTQETETRNRINLISELLRGVILPRADSEVVRALDAIENDRLRRSTP